MNEKTKKKVKKRKVDKYEFNSQIIDVIMFKSRTSIHNAQNVLSMFQLTFFSAMCV